MKLSTRVRYGCRAMVDLALRRDEGFVPLDSLAEHQNIPDRYLAKIVQDLRRAGLIRSERGAHGGYQLSDSPEQVTLLQVWEALEGPINPVDCLDYPEGCPTNEECVTRDVWARIRDSIVAVLESVTLADLAARKEAGIT